MKVDEEAAFQSAVSQVRDGLIQIAAEFDATFEDRSDSEEKAPNAPPHWFRLSCGRDGAARIDVMPDNAWSTYIEVGLGGWIEVFTSAKDTRGVADILAIVRAIVEGRLKERVWRRKRDGKLVNSVLYLQWKPDQKWHLIGEISRPLPLIRTLLLSEETIQYAAYR